MKFIKLALLGAVGIFIVVWLMSLLFPSSVRVSRAINIHASAETVHIYLADMNRWMEWNEMISAENIVNREVDDRSFSSDRLTIHIESISRDSVRATWTLKNGKKVTGGFNLFSGSNNTVTAIQWYLDFRLRWYPWEKIGSIIFDRQLGPVMEKSLDNLRNLIEQKQ